MSPDRLSPLDASFLHIEDHVSHMHIASVAIFEGPPPPKDLPPMAKPPAEGGIKGLLANISTLRVDADDDFVPLSDAKLDSFGLADGKEALRIEVGTLKFGSEKKELTKEILAIGAPTKDGKQVVICIASAPGAIDIVDIATLKLVKTIPVRGPLHNVYVTPDGNYAVAGSVAIIIAVLTAVGTEAKGIAFTKAKAAIAS